MIRWVKTDGEVVSKDHPEYSQREKAMIDAGNELIARLRGRVD